MRKSRSSPIAAFTLVELMVGATLAAAVMAAVLSSYIYLARNLGRLANQQTLETEARRTLAYFTQDVQSATGMSVTALTAPDFSITFTLANNGASGTTTQVTYYYSRDGAATSICGTSVTVAAHTLIRATGTGSALTQPAQTLLRNIVTSDDGCAIRFYDGSGTAFDNGSAPYTPTVTSYAKGIKLASLQFSTQLGTAAAGNRTQVYPISSGRILFRNKPSLP